MAHAAREKLSQSGKEKQMQAERKRKAAMFINMLKSTNKALSSQSAGDVSTKPDDGNYSFLYCT